MRGVWQLQKEHHFLGFSGNGGGGIGPFECGGTPLPFYGIQLSFSTGEARPPQRGKNFSFSLQCSVNFEWPR
jgi:hypothetical protein